MSEVNNNLKNDRISDTNEAANVSPENEVKTESKQEVIGKPILSLDKNKSLRMIGYPVALGTIGAFTGFQLAKKFDKSTKLFALTGLLVFSSLGYYLYKNLESKNIK